MAPEPKRPTGDGCVLPVEICTEILSRLPAKSILRFRSVRKSWYSLISSPNFISDYSVKTLNKNGHRVLLQSNDFRDDDTDCSFISHNESFMESREHDDVPQAFLDSGVCSNVRIVGSCNGLVCLCKYEYDDTEVTFLIWNPTIRKVVKVPSGSAYMRLDSLAFSYYGFGFDSKTGDYKVMCTHRSYCDGNLCEIFDLKKGVWRRISPPLSLNSWHCGGLRRTQECYLDGAAHWSGSTYLLSFDMSGEIFREIRMPDCAEFAWSGDVDDEYDDSRVDTRCVALGGLIHVIVWKTLTKQEGHAVDMDDECSVWALKEYGVAESWTKMFSIDLLGAGVHRYIEPNKFRLWENGEVLMVHDFPEVRYREDYDSEDEDDYDDEEYDSDEDMELVDRQGLLLYNPNSGKCKQFFSFTDHITDMCLYEESLVLM